MRKVWVTIITYNNIEILNKNLHALMASDLVTSGLYEWSIEIINNHSNFYIEPRFEKSVVVHHQTLRPTWDYVGYFTRDCNSALIRGFKSLKAPINDQVIILQDDVLVKPDFMKKLVERHESGIDFIMSGIGDALNSFVPNAVRKIGLYDERFHTGFHEGDYILRAIQKLDRRCSIGDFAHGRIWNVTDDGKFYTSNNGGDEVFPDASVSTNTTRAESDLVICPPFTQEQMNNVGKRHGAAWHLDLWKLKWGVDTPFYNWSDDFKERIIPTLNSGLPNFMVYPYFEKHIDLEYHAKVTYKCDCGRCLRAAQLGVLSDD
jgi:hypothetical protein